jgi:hypothetical protein
MIRADRTGGRVRKDLEVRPAFQLLIPTKVDPGATGAFLRLRIPAFALG